jgi:hypothetical protein
MHAIPTKQFRPFICNEYWSWSETTTHMLLNGERDDRVINIGSLEHEHKAAVNRNKQRPNGEKRVLFLSQVGLDEAWGVNAIRNGMKTFQEGLQRCRQNVAVRVREHPNADGIRRQKLLDLLDQIPYSLSDRSNRLADDIEWATHVYSVSSNAILAALLGRKPAYLFWNAELDEIYGRCFLPDECIIKNASDMAASLEKDHPAQCAETILQEVLGPPGALDRAAERLSALVTTC